MDIDAAVYFISWMLPWNQTNLSKHQRQETTWMLLFILPASNKLQIIKLWQCTEQQKASSMDSH